jgi:(1->4)-alpha-D-glucan 1-alpha-D-glucosylmutase
MGVGGSDNALWLMCWSGARIPTMQAGLTSIGIQIARYLLNKLLIPFLGDQYGVELKAGNLKLKYDEAEGTLAIWAYDTHKLPICPLFYDRVLAHEDAVLDRMSDLFSDLPMWRPQVAERVRALKAELASLVRDNIASRTALDAQVAALNNDWQALDKLIQEQFWRVAYYGVAGDDINYRRFFNVNDLAGLRMELPAVFRHTHARIIPMIEDGTLDGIRLDHVDGLLDPKRYFDDLRAASPRPFYLVIEKILAAHEQLRGLAGRGNDRLRLHQPRPRRDDQLSG